MKSSAVDILVAQGHFDQRVAFALGEAMEAAITEAFREREQENSLPPKTDLKIELHRVKNDVLCQMYTALWWQSAVLVISACFFVGLAAHS